MKKLNVNVRFKNPSFWYMLGAFILSYVFAYYGITGAELTSWASVGTLVKSVLENPAVLVPLAIGILGHFIDFTTPGMTDSQRAMTYKKPGGDA